MTEDKTLSGKELFLARLAIGLAQGLALYLLYKSQDGLARSWPATNGLVFAPLLLVWLFIPLLLNSALGEMRWRRAAAWAVFAAIVFAVLAVCDNWSAWPQDLVFAGKEPVLRPHIVPSPQLFVFGGAGLFIAHALVVGGHIDRRFMATYPTHFDVAWKLAVQAALAALFVGAFWLLLFLGASLFNLIKLDFFQKLIAHVWFAIPVTTLAAAGALHLTDIRPALVRGARTLLLTLLSWLLPMLTLIVAGFLVSLPFTGLAPLWSVGHASALLLGASAVIIILINAAHQDGEPERMPPQILRIAGSIAAILPVPLSLIAAYALYLRVGQYGWSADRVAVAACVLVAIAYAGGYSQAVMPREPWLKRIEAWNFAVALLILAVLLAVLSPIASPQRIAVADQMARLDNGKIRPEQFDIAYLRRSGGRFGRDALEKLSHGKFAALKQGAINELQSSNEIQPAKETAQSLAARFRVHPQGSTLPTSFLAALLADKSGSAIRCPQTCDAVLADLDGDGNVEILLFSTPTADARIYRNPGDGDWRFAGSISTPVNCLAFFEGMRDGRFSLVPQQHPWNNVIVGGARFTVSDESDHVCPKSERPPLTTPRKAARR